MARSINRHHTAYWAGELTQTDPGDVSLVPQCRSCGGFRADPACEAGFDHVVIVDTASDLTAYNLVEGQSACCSPAVTSSTGLPIASAAPAKDPGVQQALADLLKRYNVNDYAASVKVYAMKP